MYLEAKRPPETTTYRVAGHSTDRSTIIHFPWYTQAYTRVHFLDAAFATYRSGSCSVSCQGTDDGGLQGGNEGLMTINI